MVWQFHSHHIDCMIIVNILNITNYVLILNNWSFMKIEIGIFSNISFDYISVYSLAANTILEPASAHSRVLWGLRAFIKDFSETCLRPRIYNAGWHHDEDKIRILMLLNCELSTLHTAAKDVWRRFFICRLLRQAGLSFKILLFAIYCQGFNTLRTEQNGRHLPGDILKCILLDENDCI